MIKLVLSDMDGTFLNSKGDFNRELYQDVKKRMQEKGVYFAPVTGKQCERVEAIFGEDTEDLWILGDSATRIKHNGEFVFESLLPNATGLKIIRLLEDMPLDHTIIACTRDAAIIREDTPPDNVKMVHGSYAQVKQVPNLMAITDDFVKITVYDHSRRCFGTKEKLSPFFDLAYIVASEAAWIDITNAGIHKGTTVEQLQRMLNVTPDETMAFGDGYNDLELMSRAAYSFAVRNAVPELQDASKFIARSNDEDAVMHTILQLLALHPDC